MIILKPPELEVLSRTFVCSLLNFVLLILYSFVFDSHVKLRGLEKILAVHLKLRPYNGFEMCM